MKPPTLESIIKHDVRLALGGEPDLVLWQNSAGVTAILGRTIRYGLCRGASDLIGVGPGGRFFALEIKAGHNRPSREQEMFMELVRSRGGFACAVWSVKNAMDALDRARNGENK